MPKGPLTDAEYEAIYRDFNAPPTRFDCGKRCAPHNEGIPFCCDDEWAVPVLYRTEWAFLKARTDLWRRFRPRNRTERRMVEETHEDHVFAVCRGAHACDRRFRSITCRIFPFYPFLDPEGNLLGLVYNYTLEGKCVLVDRPRWVTRRYRREALRFWRRLLERLPEEKAFFIRESAQFRRIMSRRKKPIWVLTETGQFRAPYRMRSRKPGRDGA